MTPWVVALLAFAVLAPPLAEAQSGRVYRIGHLTPFPLPNADEQAFRQALHELGYVLDRNLITRYGDEGWRATFYPAGRGHSVTSAVGSAWERQPWIAVRQAAWESLRKREAETR